MRKKVATKDRIIDTAENLIREEGLKACSMRRISKELNIASGTVYNYYETREAMLRDVFDRSWSKTFASIHEVVVASEDVVNGLRGIADILSRDIRNRNGLGGELMAEGEDALKTDLKNRHRSAIDQLLEKHLGSSDHGKLSRWLMVLVMDGVLDEEGFVEEDWIRIGRLLTKGVK